MSYTNPFDEEDEGPRSSNYFGRHWRGQNSLAYAYWINGTLLSGVLIVAISAIGRSIESSGASLRIVAGVGLGLIAASLLAWVWGAVGIWRSAIRHPFRGGGDMIATIVKGLTVLGCLAMAFRVPGLYLQTRELGLLAAGSDPIGKSASITLRPDGMIQVDGFLSQGFADRFAEALKANRSAQAVVLNSPGGRLREGEQFARQVKAAGLDTVVEGECSSACILPYIAGKRRLMGASARLGFHQPTFPGASAAELRSSTADFRDSLISAGIDRAFAYQAVTAAPDDMWYPEARRLIDARVVTGLAPGAVEADNRRSAESIAKTLPRRIDAYTQLGGVKADGKILEYTYRVSLSAGQINVPHFASGMRESITTQACAKPELVLMFEAGAIYRYIYNDSRGAQLVSFDLASCSDATVVSRSGSDL